MLHNGGLALHCRHHLLQGGQAGENDAIIINDSRGIQ